MLLGFLLVALFIWIAENVGTFTAAWVYPNQKDGWSLVPMAKLGSWYLLMMLSFVLVTLVHRPERAPAGRACTRPAPSSSGTRATWPTSTACASSCASGSR